MKKFIVLALSALAFVMGEVQAQFSLSGALDALTGGSKSQTSQPSPAERFAAGAPAARQIVARWVYDSAAIEYICDNSLARMGVEAARGKLAEAYAKAGIVRGCGSVQLRRNGTFSAVSGDYAVDGRYEYDPKSGRIVFDAAVGGESVECGGYIALAGQRLTVLLDLNEALAIAKRLYPQLTSDQSLAGIAALVEALPGIYAGGVMTR